MAGCALEQTGSDNQLTQDRDRSIPAAIGLFKQTTYRHKNWILGLLAYVPICIIPPTNKLHAGEMLYAG